MPHLDTPLESIPSSKKAHFWALAGVVTCALLAVLQLASGQLPFAILAGLGSVIAAISLAWSYRVSIVHVYEDGLTVKLAPLARLKSAGFDQIDSVRETKRDIFVKLRHGKGKKDIKIPRFVLEKKDQQWLVEKLKYEIAAS